MRLSERLRPFSRRLSVPAGVIAGFAAFALWMSSVGEPHVLETERGLMIAPIAGTLVWFLMRRL